MLELLLGRSGSGKSKLLLDRLAACVAAGREKLILLVPEQNSFENERQLLKRLSPADASRVQVLSFTHLAETVFREVGGIAGERLDEGGCSLLMSRAVEQVVAVAEDAGETLFGVKARQISDPDYISALMSLWRELRQCAVPPEELDRVGDELSDADTLAGRSVGCKSKDLYKIFTAYEGLLQDDRVDETELLTALERKLPDSTLPDGATVMVDGFKGFTVREAAVLEAFVARADTVTVTLGTDTAGKANGAREYAREFSLFSPVTDTVSVLREMASRHGCPVNITMTDENRRAQNTALRELERQLYLPHITPVEEPADAVTVIPCGDFYDECAYTARAIRRLMREEGYRAREITVVARDLDAYRGILDDAFEQAGIPFYTDVRQDLLCEPLTVYVRAALRLAIGGWKTEELLRLLKTDLTPLDPVEIARWENYLYLWQIDGAALNAAYIGSPAGMDAPATAQTARQLEELNHWRQTVFAPLENLRRALRGQATGRAFAEALYRYLQEDTDLPTRIMQTVDRLEEAGEPLLADHAARLWDELMGVLDRFALVLSDQPIPAERLESMFTMLMQTVDMGHIPQGLDAVTVGSAHRIRYTAPRAVFILGANEGVFPAYPSQNALLDEEARAVWEEHGIRLSGDILRHSIEERYFAYAAVSAPSEKLFVTYAIGGGRVASPLVKAIDAILPRHTVGEEHRADGEDIEYAADAFSRLAAGRANADPLTATLTKVVEDTPLWCDRLEAVHRAASHEPFRLHDPATTAALFGGEQLYSATRTDTFFDCRFAYFCKYGLSLKPRPVARVDEAMFGTVVHYVMETVLPVYTAPGGLIDLLRGEDALHADETAAEEAERENERQKTLMPTIREDVGQAVARFLDERMGGKDGKTGRFIYQLHLAERAAVNMLWHTVMELRQSDFRARDFELEIARDAEDGKIVSARLPFSAGEIGLIGKIDRVDLFLRDDGRSFARVVDYKTRSSALDLNFIPYGINMQMLLYLFVLCDNCRRYLDVTGELRPAGVLYQPLSDVTSEPTSRTVREKKLKSMAMTGLVLDNASVITAMESKTEKLYIPAYINKDGMSDGSVVTAAQFDQLRRMTERLLVDMAETLVAGDIDARPLYKENGHDACKYCDFRAVCAREAGDPRRTMAAGDLKKALAETEGENDASE